MVKPILFNNEMVRAILDGRKTVTRRAVKDYDKYERLLGIELKFPMQVYKAFNSPCEPGDILWVRETWGDYREERMDGESGYFYLYRADYPDGATSVPLPESERTDYADSWDLPKWHPSIHMPKEAARIFLRVTDVRVERLQEIDVDGIRAEGLTSACVHAGDMEIAAQEFALLWNSTINPADRDRYGWEANPFCWVIEFERCEKPEEVWHMGVYIKSMEMPDSCRKCELFIDCDNCDGWETMCAILGPIGYLNEIPNDFRHQNCPLVEVKTPHGRLIDADALDLHDEEERAHNEVVEVARESGCGSPTHLYYSAFYEGLLTITSKIRFAPTTIEAEAKT